MKKKVGHEKEKESKKGIKEVRWRRKTKNLEKRKGIKRQVKKKEAGCQEKEKKLKKIKKEDCLERKNTEYM